MTRRRGRSSPPSATTSPTSNTFTEGAGLFSALLTVLTVRGVMEWPCKSGPTPDTADVAFGLVKGLTHGTNVVLQTAC
jgi:hypothetical protein